MSDEYNELLSNFKQEIEEKLERELTEKELNFVEWLEKRINEST
ncbi:hypothetical protein [Aquibacillus salsiterrae]|nr:hypothetical protein [Aquibacillus salsiterrae]